MNNTKKIETKRTLVFSGRLKMLALTPNAFSEVSFTLPPICISSPKISLSPFFPFHSQLISTLLCVNVSLQFSSAMLRSTGVTLRIY
ncbi:hypothetical protein K1719_027723 [Acacia pycnantha]|nr:hypothetical protein K1719_027723 [Acacia pycnantha]